MSAGDAAYRARKAANQRAYRARQKAAQSAKAPRGGAPHGGGAVQKAQRDAQAARTERDATLRKLPNAMSIDKENPLSKKTPRIIPPMRTDRAEGPVLKSKSAQAKRAAAIRENVAAEKVRSIGRERQNALRIELTDGKISEQLQEMSRFDRARFAEYTERIAGISQQALGVLFKYGGGQGLYNSAIEKILYEKNREAGFDVLRSLVEHAERADELYSPRALRAQGLGDRAGRLNI